MKDDTDLEFECQLCGNAFPADPSGVIESVEKDELEEMDDWNADDWDYAKTKEIYFICPECMNYLESNDEGEL